MRWRAGGRDGAIEGGSVGGEGAGVNREMVYHTSTGAEVRPNVCKDIMRNVMSY